MILRLVHPGTAGRGPLAAAADDYRGRLGRAFRVEEVFVKPSRRRERERALAEEADRLRAVVRPRELLVALDREGHPWSSEDLARRLETWMGEGTAGVAFALGSAEGLAPSLVGEARVRWSFGPLTLPHDLARVILWEQLYRAHTILRGEPYHK